MTESTEQRVIADILKRQEIGLRKYGMTVSANPLSLKAWLQHQYEELLDAAIYCRRAIEEIDKTTDPATQWRDEGFARWRNER